MASPIILARRKKIITDGNTDKNSLSVKNFIYLNIKKILAIVKVSSLVLLLIDVLPMAFFSCR